MGNGGDYQKDDDKGKKTMTDEEKIKEIFTYHAPKEGQPEKYNEIRSAAEAFALVIKKNTPKCADQSTAIRKVREAVMVANAAIALDGLV